MCRANDHGGRRCPHDNAKSRRVRRHRSELTATLTPQLHQAQPSPVVMRVDPAEANLDTVRDLRTRMTDLRRQYTTIRSDPFGVSHDEPLVLAGISYTDSVQALAALEETMLDTVALAGDALAQQAARESGLAEDTLADLHIYRTRLETLAAERDAFDAHEPTAAEVAEGEPVRAALRQLATRQFAQLSPLINILPLVKAREQDIHVTLLQYVTAHPDDADAQLAWQAYERHQAEMSTLKQQLRDIESGDRVASKRNRTETWALLTGPAPETGQPPIVREHALAYARLLAQVRPMGVQKPVQYQAGSHEPKTAVLDIALTNYPTAWITHAQDARQHPLYVRRGPERAHYRHKHTLTTGRIRDPLLTFEDFPADWTPSEAQSEDFEALTPDAYDDYTYTYPSGRTHTVPAHTREPNTSVWARRQYEYQPAASVPAGIRPGYHVHQDTIVMGTGERTTKTRYRRQKYELTAQTNKTVSELTINDAVEGSVSTLPGYADALHEYAHRIEYAGPPIVALLEDRFLQRRTTQAGQREALQRIYPGKEEYGYFDGFVDRYMGRVYDRSVSREVLSTGMEAIFAGTMGGLVGGEGYAADPDMKRFILGLLATV